MSKWGARDADEARKQLLDGTAVSLPATTDDFKRLYNALREKWRRRRAAFVSFWEQLEEERRKDLVLTVSPYTPISPSQPVAVTGDDVRGAAKMVPEMSLELARDASALPNLLDHFLRHDDFDDALREAVYFVQSTGCVRQSSGSVGRVFVEMSELRFFSITPEGGDTALQALSAIPTMVSQETYDAGLQRLSCILVPLSGIVEDWQGESLPGTHSSLIDTIIGCNNPSCGAKECSDGSKLKICRRCGTASYCSREWYVSLKL